MKRLNHAVTIRCLAAVAFLGALGAVFPEWSQGQAVAPAAAEIRIVNLRYANAEAVADTICQFLDASDGSMTAQVIADPRVNCLIIRASEAETHEILRLVEQLDSNVPATEREVRVFPLRNTSPDNSLASVLSIISADEASISVDAERNVVVAAGTLQTLEMIENLLNVLDVQQTPKPEVGTAELPRLQVRLVWLVQVLDQELPVVPDDLENVLGELTSLGIDNLQLGTEVIVNTTPNSRFIASGVANIDQPYSIEVAGTVGVGESPTKGGNMALYRADHGDEPQPAGDGSARQVLPNSDPVVQLTLSAKGRDDQSAGCRVQTTIRAPLGQSVVLAATPTGSLTSVFVVQVRPF